MAEIKETLECLKKKATEALEVYTKKDAWKPEDLVGAKDAMKLYNEVCDGMMKDGIWQEMKGEWGSSNGMRGYSGMNYSNGMNNSNGMNDGNSNGMNNSGYYGPQYGNSGWNMPHGTTRISYGSESMGYSGARGRDADTGQYVSRNAMYHDPRYQDSYGYDNASGHSVKDRMIAALEQQMDAAKTEYEREEVRKAIAEIERMKR